MSCGIKIWLAERCIREARISGGVEVLRRDFNRWLGLHHQSDCEAEAFEELLADEGVEVREVAGIRLAIGLGFRKDWEVYA